MSGTEHTDQESTATTTTDAFGTPAKEGDTRTLAGNSTRIRELIYEFARSGNVFSMDDVIEKLGSSKQVGVIHASLLSATKMGLLERLGRTKSRRLFVAEDWVAGNAPKRRSVITYRGAARFRKQEKEAK